MAEKLTDEQVDAALADLDGWKRTDTHIRKEFTFKGFKSAIAFIVRIAFEAEARDHHPDLENHYNKVIVALRSWDADGITKRDLDLATAIEKAST